MLIASEYHKQVMKIISYRRFHCNIDHPDFNRWGDLWCARFERELIAKGEEVKRIWSKQINFPDRAQQAVCVRERPRA